MFVFISYLLEDGGKKGLFLSGSATIGRRPNLTFNDTLHFPYDDIVGVYLLREVRDPQVEHFQLCNSFVLVEVESTRQVY